MPVTINDLKNHLNGGLRKNKYMIELSKGDLNSEKFNVLCTAASLPQRTIQTTSVFRHGRKYNIRAETDYGSEYEVTVLDDNNLTIRRFFDDWMQSIDDSGANAGNFFGLDSNDNIFGKIIDTVNDVRDVINTASEIISEPGAFFDKITSGLIEGSSAYAVASYQTEINVWQLDHNGNKVYGYKLQNAFPTALGIVTYDSSIQNELVTYTVTFTYSEFMPITKNSGTVSNTFSSLF